MKKKKLKKTATKKARGGGSGSDSVQPSPCGTKNTHYMKDENGVKQPLYTSNTNTRGADVHPYGHYIAGKLGLKLPD